MEMFLAHLASAKRIRLWDVCLFQLGEPVFQRACGPWHGNVGAGAWQTGKLYI